VGLYRSSLSCKLALVLLSNVTVKVYGYGIGVNCGLTNTVLLANPRSEANAVVMVDSFAMLSIDHLNYKAENP
jgi:hypothetical protein